MKCGRFLSFVLVAVLAFFSGLFITSQNSYALEDISVTYSSWNADSPVFPDCDSSCLSQYSYLTISSSRNNLSNVFFVVGSNQYLNIIFPYYNGSNSTSSFAIIQDFNFSTFNFRHSITSYSPITFILSDSFSFGASSPTGNIDISSNGTYDVTNYASATVNVPAEIIQGDYHDDLIAINNSILICAAVCLVIYFFYCIYRLIIKNSGVH